ncbi:MAG TPA: phenylalanine--tRNA ligase subunit alpha [Solirubrobacterales bacterium]|nr:phenylalanine--tRNA ligase subunit alpha [Solirubrobacterales bacterium]
MLERIEEIRDQAGEAIEAATGTAELEELRIRYLGRKAELTTILRGIGELGDQERGRVGAAANQARQALERRLAARAERLDSAELDARLLADRVDVTLPGAPPLPVGHLHLITRTTRQIEDVMVGLGYRVMEGPEIEHDYYNFTALNHPPGHPARMLQDTFYLDPSSIVAGLGNRPSGESASSLRGETRSGDASSYGAQDVLLRTHTSPMQVRAMETQQPPIFVVVPGKVYRRDSDATHSPMFHQMEGLAVAEGITLADLKGTLLTMVRALFGEERQVRLRPHFFPFTEPSLEVDVSCFQCGGSGELAGGERCNLCKGQGWIEILGAGMVDPKVLGFVAANGYDPQRVQGFAFGLGIERVAMLRHGVPDLRRFFDNDLQMLEQFL